MNTATSTVDDHRSHHFPSCRCIYAAPGTSLSDTRCEACVCSELHILAVQTGAKTLQVSGLHGFESHAVVQCRLHNSLRRRSPFHRGRFQRFQQCSVATHCNIAPTLFAWGGRHACLKAGSHTFKQHVVLERRHLNTSPTSCCTAPSPAP